MTKFELKQIIKGLIVESINESKLQESTPKGFPKKLKKKILKQYPGEKGKAKAYATMQKVAKQLDEQDEMEPIDPLASAEPDAGEVEGPAEPQGEHAELLAQIDSIIGSLNSLKANLQGHAEGEEEVSDEEEVGEEEEQA